MRYSIMIIILVTGLQIVLYCVLYMENVGDIFLVGENITVAKVIRKIDVEYKDNHIFPRSTYDVYMVNWTLTCSRSSAYLADLAYTLKQITDVMEEFEITYMLDSATLLGALRMNGPLPYDDDIDIAVLEEDFKPKKHLIYDAMRKRKFLVQKYNKRNKWYMEKYLHINMTTNCLIRPYIDIFMLRKSRNKKYFELLSPYYKMQALCPFKMTTIFGREQQTPSSSTPIPTTTVSAPRGPQVVPRALEAAWYHYKAQQRRTRAVLRPGLQKILHHRYGMLSTVMFLGRLYPAAADPFGYADCEYYKWYNKYYLNRPHLACTEAEMCKTVMLHVSMSPSHSDVSPQHKRGAATSAYIMLERLKKTMCYQAKQSADIMLQGTLVNEYNNSIVTIEEEYNATDTIVFQQMCSMEESLCNVTFACDDMNNNMK